MKDYSRGGGRSVARAVGCAPSDEHSLPPSFSTVLAAIKKDQLYPV